MRRDNRQPRLPGLGYDPTLNVLLDRAGERLFAYMLSHEVPRAGIETTLDQMAATCEARLTVLDRAALGSGG